MFLIAQPGIRSTATFTIEPSGIPFEPLLGEAVTLADPHGPRIGDLNGDGASDVAIWLSGKLHIFENQARDQDLLIGVHQGSNPHDPTDPEYVPDVSISYGHLTDSTITANTDSGALSNESALYLSRWDKANECTYPRRCSVGARRVVSGYRLFDGVDGERRYSLRYRDGRVFVAQGFLGFGAQRFEYDRLTSRVSRRSIPIREDAPENKVEWETFVTDGLGREVKRTAAFGATTETEFDGLTIKTTDPLGNVSIAENDALGRKIAVTDAANGVTMYTYGPFGRMVKVTGPDGAATLTTFDAMGRPIATVDPDKGTAKQSYNSFGELVSLVDALGNETTFERDPIGRVTKRLDDLGATTEITTWTYDTAPNGKGKIHHVKSIDAEKTYTYDKLGRVESVSLEVIGSSPAMAGKIGYDLFGRMESLTYPTVKSSAPFAVVQEYDAHGFTRKVQDRNSDLTYWQLTGVDDAGRFAQEQMGNGVSTTHRTYFSAQQRLKSITTENAAGLVQSLEVEWDARLNLKSRTDDLQPQHTTERFRYDALERLTCSYFSAQEDLSAPCDWSYQYAPNGNLTYKSDVGALEYNDPAHPHGATTAGGAAYQYDATGNQTARPGGVKVAYTAFDLPRTITQPNGEITFGYDGDQKRVRKTTTTHETLYFVDLYERVKDAANAITERFYVRSPERVIAIVTRGGNQPGTTYVHTDHLGSVDALTDADGKVTARRSYDAFGQRRNPEWGAPVPASFPDSTSLGFAGHEDDGEIGLVNMKGRMFDPKLGRFVSTDPIVQDWTFSQAWNPYSYVFNNPLTYTDPSGFDGEPQREASLPVGPNGFVEISVPGIKAGPPKEEKPKKETEHGVGEPNTDVDTTGSEDITAEPDEEAEDEPWYNHPVLQTMAGGFNGALLGIVPGAGVAEEAALAEGLVERRSVYFERGKALGMIGGGLYTTAMSLGGEIFGGAATVTGVGAAVGVPAIAISTVGVVGGAGNILAGINAWMSMSGATPPDSAQPRVSGEALKAARKEFASVKPKFWKNEAATNPGKYTPAQLEDMMKGNAPIGSDGFRMELHHYKPLAEGGTNDFGNLRPLTRTEHRLGDNYRVNHPNLP
ncbi:MAG: hypothetical protein IPK82_22435 [Polyangiaceae bacterium]|nr:hypothetical protein [Polyangiaceae bacterium]